MRILRRGGYREHPELLSANHRTHRRKVAALNAAPTMAQQAVSHATPRAWCEALLHGEIVTPSAYALFDAVFGA
jgi:hypothetical protein